MPDVRLDMDEPEDGGRKCSIPSCCWPIIIVVVLLGIASIPIVIMMSLSSMCLIYFILFNIQHSDLYLSVIIVLVLDGLVGALIVVVTILILHVV